MTLNHPLASRRRLFCSAWNGRAMSGAFAAVLLVFASMASHAQSRLDEEDDEDAPKTWQENAIEMPAPPRPENLLPVELGSGMTQSFFIDAPSVSVGSDGVVRYTLVAKSSGGATNVSYEGIRCESYERKLYAFGQPDGSWSRARRGQWQKISAQTISRQQMALAKDYFCDQLTVAGKASDMVARIREKRPLSTESYR